ncbi:hypothetical protein Btru_069743 [Bulinus truncatus]|nr:hypothetical protein Btru_069743 [Bulinus truncatus]
MYTTDSLKKNFIRNLISFVRAKNIDGLNVDVQPAEGGHKEQFTLLFKDLKAAFEEESSRTKRPKLLLSVGIPSDKTFLDKYYDVAAISNYVDMLNLATYSFVVQKSCAKNPQHHSPLYSPDPSSTKTIDFMSRYVSGKGISKDKINVGIALFSLTHRRTSYCGWLADVFASNYMRCSQLVTQIYESTFSRLDKEVGRLVTWEDDDRKTFYDDRDTIKIKAKYAIDNGYGGVILFSTTTDDFFGFCNEGNHPLAKAVYEECVK